MRTYGRLTNSDGSYTWTQISTDANGNDDLVWLTTLIQCLKLELGESPMFATYGIPSRQSVITQVSPDYYVSLMQQAFAPYFASLLVTKVAGQVNPTYVVSVMTHAGVSLTAKVAG